MTLIRIVRTAAASQAMVTSKGITRVFFSKPVSRTVFDQRVLILVGVAMHEEKHMVPSPSKTSIAYQSHTSVEMFDCHRQASNTKSDDGKTI